MKLYVDLETLQLIEGPGFRNPITSLRFKRGDAAQLEVSFLEGGVTPVVIGDLLDLVIRFGVKPRNRYDVGYLVHSADWTMPAVDAENPVYQCSPSFNTEELDSALGVGSSTGTELSEITLMGEITWSEGTGEPTSTRTFLVVVENDVNRGTEGVPTSAEPPYPPPENLLTASSLGDMAVRHDMAQALTANQKTQVHSNIGGGKLVAHIAFVRNGAAGPGVVGDPNAPFPTIRAALTALPATTNQPRNIVLLNSMLGEAFTFVPESNDPAFHIEAVFRTNRFVFSDLAPSEPSAVIQVTGWGAVSNTWLRTSSNRTVGVRIPSLLTPYSGNDLLFDCEGLASFEVYASSDQAPSLGNFFCTLRNCGYVNFTFENFGSETFAPDKQASLFLFSSGENCACINVTDYDGAPFFGLDFIVYAHDCLFGMNYIDTTGGSIITLAGCGHSYYSVYSGGFVDAGGNYYNEIW